MSRATAYSVVIVLPDGSTDTATVDAVSAVAATDYVWADRCYSGCCIASCTPVQRRVEAYGVKGLRSTAWRRTFASPNALHAWCDAHDAVVHAYADIIGGR